MRKSITQARGLLILHLPSLSIRSSPRRVRTMKKMNQREMGLYGWLSPSGESDKAGSLNFRLPRREPFKVCTVATPPGLYSLGDCSRCGTNPSYYTRRYSGESLCAACFEETTVDKVR